MPIKLTNSESGEAHRRLPLWIQVKENTFTGSSCTRTSRSQLFVSEVAAFFPQEVFFSSCCVSILATSTSRQCESFKSEEKMSIYTEFGYGRIA